MGVNDHPAGSAIPFLVGTIIYAVLGMVGCIINRVCVSRGVHSSERYDARTRQYHAALPLPASPAARSRLIVWFDCVVVCWQ